MNMDSVLLVFFVDELCHFAKVRKKFMLTMVQDEKLSGTLKLR